jgi:transcription elongation factor Elf1
MATEVPADHKPYSTAPCAKCGALKVRCTLEDEPDGRGTYYDIKCEACGHAYATDGPDA